MPAPPYHRNSVKKKLTSPVSALYMTSDVGGAKCVSLAGGGIVKQPGRGLVEGRSLSHEHQVNERHQETVSSMCCGQGTGHRLAETYNATSCSVLVVVCLY
ncbi:hypothetical protein E2C01_059468 [Portunus trituberculatus]|uniref:Uncharacterized protein n=1 Tax=Portunus trituberculatus TaxID=210409 RepID=A0A5B7H6S3_PORTR|nr:hypothetical protein [Portunus trituberculatus]